MKKEKAITLVKENFLVTVYAVLALILMLMISTRGEAQFDLLGANPERPEACPDGVSTEYCIQHNLHHTPPSQIEGSDVVSTDIQACRDAAKATEVWCGAVNPLTPALAQMIGSLVHGQGDTLREQCKKAVTAEKYGIGTIATTYYMCNRRNNACQSTCNAVVDYQNSLPPEMRNYAERTEARMVAERTCTTGGMQQMALIMSASQLIQNLQRSSQCEALSDGDEDDPEKVAKGECEKNPQLEECRCKFFRENGIPAPAYCGGGDGEEDPQYKDQFARGDNPLGDPDFSGLDGYGDEINDPYNGNDLGEGGPANLAGNQDGGGSYTPNAGGAGGGAGGGEGNKGPGKGPYDVDVLRGTTSGQGGGGYAAGGGGGNRGGSYGGGRTGDDKMKFDLSKYLPGQKKAQKRSIAKIESQTTVSAANGMTNFEKISRRMNQQRARLLP